MITRHHTDLSGRHDDVDELLEEGRIGLRDVSRIIQGCLDKTQVKGGRGKLFSCSIGHWFVVQLST